VFLALKASNVFMANTKTLFFLPHPFAQQNKEEKFSLELLYKKLNVLPTEL